MVRWHVYEHTIGPLRWLLSGLLHTVTWTASISLTFSHRKKGSKLRAGNRFTGKQFPFHTTSCSIDSQWQTLRRWISPGPFHETETCLGLKSLQLSQSAASILRWSCSFSWMKQIYFFVGSSSHSRSRLNFLNVKRALSSSAAEWEWAKWCPTVVYTA